MKHWERASNYMGQDHSEYLVLLWRNRDSGCLDRSNFSTALERLGGEDNGVLVIRSNHWAVGWVEFIGIHQDATDKLAIAHDIEGELADYPILNDEHYYSLQYEEINSYWQSVSLSERLELCDNAEISIFAIRHDTMTNDIFDHLLETWD